MDPAVGVDVVVVVVVAGAVVVAADGVAVSPMYRQESK